MGQTGKRKTILLLALLAAVCALTALCAIIGYGADKPAEYAEAAGTAITLTEEEKLASIGLHGDVIGGDHVHTGATALTQAMVDSSESFAAGNYYLSENIALDAKTKIVFTGNIATNICLNGKTLSVKEGATVSTMIQTAQDLSIYDCEGGGIITGGTPNGYDIFIMAGANFYMHGGVIAGNKTLNEDYAGSIVVNGNIGIIDGGVIKDNSGYHFMWFNSIGEATVKNCIITGNNYSYSFVANMGGVSVSYENCRITDNQMMIPVYGGVLGNNVVIERNKRILFEVPGFKIGSATTESPCYISIVDNSDVSLYDVSSDNNFTIVFNTPLAEGSKIQMPFRQTGRNLTSRYNVCHPGVDPNTFFVNTTESHLLFYDVGSQEVRSKKITKWTTEYAREDWTYGSTASVETAPVAVDGVPVAVEYYTDAQYSEKYTGTFDASTPAGTYYVKCRVAGTGTYTELEGRYSFNVARKVLTDSIVGNVGGTFTYNGSEHRPTVTFGDTALTASDYEMVWSNNINSGDATLTITGKKNYTGTIIRTFTIGKAAITPVITLGDWMYGQTGTPELSGNTGAGEATYLYTGVSNDGTQYNGSVPPTKAGSYKLTVTIAETPNYLGETAEKSFVIGRASVSAPNIPSQINNGSQQTANVPTSDRYTVTENMGGTSNGNYPVILTLTDYNNYKWEEGVSVSGTYDENATLTFTISGEMNSWTIYPTVANKMYGQTVTAQYEAKYGNATVGIRYRTAGGEPLSAAPKASGNYTAVFSVNGTVEYSSLYAEVSFKITPKTITVKIDDKTSVYGQPIASLTYSVFDASELVNGDTEDVLKIALKKASGTKVGTYGITGTDEDDNYEIEFVDGIYAITKATYDMTGVTFADKTYTYNGKAKSIEIGGTLPIGVSVSYEGNGKTDAGTYTVTATFTGDSVNYNAIEEKTAKLYIDKANYDMTGVRWSYSEAIAYSGMSCTVVLDNLPDGVTAAYTGNSNIDVGKYTASVVFTYDTKNYNTPVIDDFNWEIKQATNIWTMYPSITVDDNTGKLLYYGSDISVARAASKFGTYKIKYEFAPDAVSEHTPVTTINELGHYHTIFYVEATANYTGLLTEQSYDLSFTVAPRKIEVVIENKTTAFAEAPVELTARLRDGYALAYDDVYADLKIALTKAEGTDVGTYNITGVCGNKNYAVTFTNGTYTIAKATNAWTTELTMSGWTYGETASSPIAAAKFGKVVYTYSASETDGYSERVPTNAGTYFVKATVADTANYAGLTATKSFVIAKADYAGITHEALNGTYNASKTLASYPLDAGYTWTDATTVPTVAVKGYAAKYNADPANYNDFELTVTLRLEKQRVRAPKIQSKVYTGEPLTADVPENALYTVRENLGGTAKDTYDVVLELKDALNYAWTAGTNVSGADDAEATLEFKIVGALNSWTSDPTVGNITYGEALTVNKGTATLGGDTIKVTYQTSSGIAVSGEPRNAGRYKAVFTIAETADYEGLTFTVEFEITKATYDMTGAKWDYTGAFAYDGTEKAVAVTGLPTGVTVKAYTGNKGTNANDYTASVTFTYDETNYNAPTLADLPWKINKADYDMSGVKFENGTVTYDGKAHGLTVTGALPTGADGVTVTVTYAGSATNVSDGAVEVTATFATTSANYNVPAPVTATVTVTPKSLTVTWGETTFTYDGKAHKPAASADTGIAGVTCEVTVSGEQTNAGDNYTATASTTNGNFTLAGETKIFVIKKADYAGITHEALRGTYDSAKTLADYALGANYAWSDATTVPTVAATAYKAKYNADPTNYNDYTLNITLTLTKATYDMSGAKWDYTDAFAYDGTEKAVAVTGLPNGVTVKAYTGNKGTNANDYTASVTLTYDETNYNAPTLDNLSWKINKATYDMSGAKWDYTDAFTYDGTEKTVAVTGLPNGVTVKAYTGNKGTNANDYTASVTLTYDETNYNAPTLDNLSWKVNKATYDMSGAKWDYTDAFTYDGTEKAVAVTGLPSGVTVKAYTGNKGTNANDYTASVTFTYDETNYNAPTLDNLSWKINKATYDMSGVKFENVTVTYDGKAHGLTVTGLPAGVTAAYDKETSYTNAGAYGVTATFTAADTANYNALTLTEKKAMLTIDKAVYDMSGIKFDNATVKYDGQPHSLAVTGTLPAGVTVTYDNNGKTDGGTYTVTAKFAGDANHEAIADMTATLTIEKAADPAPTPDPGTEKGGCGSVVMDVFTIAGISIAVLLLAGAMLVRRSRKHNK